MINQSLQTELKKVDTRITHLEQKIEFRKHGGSAVGSFTSELIEAKVNRNRLLSDIGRENYDDSEAEFKEFEKQNERIDALTESTKELQEKLKAQSLYINCLTKEKPRKKFPEIVVLKDFSEIGIKMTKERNLEGVLKNAQKLFDQAKQKSENAPKMYSGKYTGQLQQSRNVLALAKRDIEQLPRLIEFYTLRAKKEHLGTVITEKEEQLLEIQAYITELEAEFALLEKHGYIKS